MDKPNALDQFRADVYACFTQRADAALNLLDALTQAGHVESPVALSEASSFQREFSSVYDVLKHGELDPDPLAQTLYASQPAECETLDGYEVYALDTTPNERPAAETLPDRGLLKSDKQAPTRIGPKYSWLVRLVKQATSWVAPLNVTRVPTETTDSQVAAEQVQALDAHSDHPKVVVADSLYGNVVFLAVFLVVKTVEALVRLRHNLTLYERPTPKAPGSKGAPRKHGAKFKLSNPTREPDRSESHPFQLFTLRLRAWRLWRA
jgi:hypothetical protein